jgi:hypothetical protein
MRREKKRKDLMKGNRGIKKMRCEAKKQRRNAGRNEIKEGKERTEKENKELMEEEKE